MKNMKRQEEYPGYPLCKKPGKAGKELYEIISAWLINNGMIRAETDPAFFYYVKHDRLIGMLALHVDDALYAGNARFNDDVIKHTGCPTKRFTSLKLIW